MVTHMPRTSALCVFGIIQARSQTAPPLLRPDWGQDR
jgi:hypothetical protein